jgi:hypothetical protein
MYTKGNWRYSKEHSEITTSKVGIVEGSKSVATLNYFNKEQSEIDANGKLISYAPEMYELLLKINNNILTSEDFNKIYNIIKNINN